MSSVVRNIPALLAAILAASVVAAPQPAVVQEPGEWTLQVEFDFPRRLAARVGPDYENKIYWYTILTVTNNTGRDVDFYPRCDLVTDTFQLLPAGRGTPLSISSRIAARHKRAYPFLEPLEDIGNRILQGEDNAKDILIVWPDFDTNANNIKLFIEGLSNETAVVEHPTETNENGDSKKLYLRKTLELDYDVGGDPAYRVQNSLVYKDKRWVMR